MVKCTNMSESGKMNNDTIPNVSESSKMKNDILPNKSILVKFPNMSESCEMKKWHFTKWKYIGKMSQSEFPLLNFRPQMGKNPLG